MVIDSGGGNVVDVDPSKNLLKIFYFSCSLKCLINTLSLLSC